VVNPLALTAGETSGLRGGARRAVSEQARAVKPKLKISAAVEAESP